MAEKVRKKLELAPKIGQKKVRIFFILGYNLIVGGLPLWGGFTTSGGS